MTDILSRFHFGAHRLPVILQTEATECGLACLAMVLGFHGRRSSITTLRRQYPVSLRGVTLKSLMDVAQRCQLNPRALRLEPNELPALRTPAILHWDLNHFVVLERSSRRHVVIHDPAIGRRRLPLAAVSRHFTGVALELTPTPGFVRRDERQNLELSRLWNEAVGLKGFMVHLLLLSLGLQALALLAPFYLQLVIDEAVLRLDTSFLGLLGAAFLCLLLIRIGVTWIRSWTVMRFTTLLSVQVQGNLLRHLLQLPLSFFMKRHVGDIVSRFGSMSAIQEILTTGLIEALLDGLMLVFTVCVLWVYEPTLATISCSVLAAYAVIRWLRYRAVKDLAVEQLVQGAESSSHFMETLRGMHTVKSFGLEAERLGQWQNRVVDLTNTGLRIARQGLGFSALNEVLFGVAHVGVVYLGATYVMDQQFTVGMLMAFMSYQGQFFGAGGALVDQWIAFRLLDVHLDRVADIALTEHESGTDTPEPPFLATRGHLSLRSVSFRYSATDPWILKDVSLDLPAGRCAVIVGPSGCGKSTLLRLIQGLAEPEAGEVLIDGVDVAKIGMPHYRRLIGAVSQEDRLLSGSILENLTLFDPLPDHAWVHECARQCGLHDAIMRMPMNYHSLIGDMGDALSAGERQRLMLARALYRRPRLLVLDEATSNLDVEHDMQIHQMLSRLDVTRIIVTHRETPLRFADQILVLRSGSLEALPSPPLQAIA